jgi:hypothetical protein
MMSLSEGSAIDLVSADLFALFALVAVSLLPEGCVAQAAASTNKQTRAKIFFMINLLKFGLIA